MCVFVCVIGLWLVLFSSLYILSFHFFPLSFFACSASYHLSVPVYILGVRHCT